jgi:L-ribulose-5-phosphate 3-epimerase
MIQYSKLGIMQGRLSPPFNNNIQHFPVNHWRDEFHILKEFGLACMEWVYEFPNIERNPLHLPNQCEEIKHIALQTGIKVNTVVADYFMVNHILEENASKQRKNLLVLKQLINHCALVDIPIVELPFVDSSSLSREQFTELVDVLSPICVFAKDKGIKISFETALPPQDFRRLLEMFSPHLIYVNYDMGNSASLGFNPSEEIGVLGSYIINVHIKDRLLAGTTVPLGKGNVDFESVFSALKNVDYKEDFILQTARQDITGYQYQQSPIESIKEYINFLKPWILKS